MRCLCHSGPSVKIFKNLALNIKSLPKPGLELDTSWIDDYKAKL